MKKSYFLFILLLLSVVGSVSAATENITIPETSATSDWWVELSDTSMTTELVVYQLNQTVWGGNAPVLTGIFDYRIYFASKDDLGRFCNIISTTSDLAFNGDFTPFECGQALPLTVIKVQGSCNENKLIDDVISINTSGAGYIYAYNHLWGGTYSWSKVVLNGVQFSYASQTTVEEFNKGVISSRNDLEYLIQSGWYNGGGANLECSFAIFDYIDYSVTQTTSYKSTVTELYCPPPRYDLELNSNVNSFDVYAGEICLGTYDNEDIIQFPAGIHELTFKKGGYWDITKTVEFIDGPVSVSLNFIPSNYLYSITTDVGEINTYCYAEQIIPFSISPIKNSNGITVSFSGAEVLEVRDSVGTILTADSNGRYEVGSINVDSSKSYTVKIATGPTLGTKNFVVTANGYDLYGNVYQGIQTISYTCNELPVRLTLPSSYVIGLNSVRVAEMQGEESTVITVELLKDGVSLWNDNYDFDSYDSHTFEFNIDETGDYSLKFVSSSFSITVPISVENPISLVENTVTGSAGSTISIPISITNPLTVPQYYDIIIAPVNSVNPLQNSTSTRVSVAPGETKTVRPEAKLNEELDFDSYSLLVTVMSTDSSISLMEDQVTLTIYSGGSSFIPVFYTDGPIYTNPYVIGAVILVLGGGYFIFRKKSLKKGGKRAKK
ncbi:COG1361 family protein [Methanococcus sp. CF]